MGPYKYFESQMSETLLNLVQNFEFWIFWNVYMTEQLTHYKAMWTKFQIIMLGRFFRFVNQTISNRLY